MCVTIYVFQKSIANYQTTNCRKLQLKVCSKISFFLPETIHLCNSISEDKLKTDMLLCAISNFKLNSKNYKKSFHLLLLLSGDIELNPGPSINLNEDMKFTKQRGFHMLHVNINSLLPKIDELRAIAESTKVALIGITESKLDSSVTDSEISIDRYDVLRLDRNRHGGGVACFIRHDIQYNILKPVTNKIEVILVDIFFPNSKPFKVGVCYRPPNQLDFLELLNIELENINIDVTEIYLLGDFNINVFYNAKNILRNVNKTLTLQNCPNILKQYREFCNLSNLKQLIESPTRITCSTTTLLDHVLTNCEEKISQSGVIDIGLSDHQMIFCTRKHTRPKSNTHSVVKYRSFKNYSKEQFKNHLVDINFPNYEAYTDIDLAYNDFYNKLMPLIDTLAPIKESRIKSDSQPWFDCEIAEKISIRDKLLKKYKKSRLHIDNDLYKSAKNDVQILIKNKKKSYFQDKLEENVGKPKKLWKILTSMGLNKKIPSSSNICLEFNNKKTFDCKTNAEIFKGFFSNLATDLLSMLPIPPGRFNIQSVIEYYKSKNIGASCFNFNSIDESLIQKHLENTKITKASGIDNMLGIFLKDGAEFICKPLTQICNLSIKLSTFPQNFKIAKLKPLYKKGSKTEPKNYRPISLLPLLSKIIEKIIHDQTKTFLDKHNILYKYQSGFRTNFSTNTCLAYLNDKISTGFDNGLYTGMILIDLQKAFDTINHSILLEKMNAIGFSKEVILWFKSYLEDRTFQVAVGNIISTAGNINCGVPQGSILGPLLFLLYVNDMSQSVSCEILLYADDTCLLYQHKDVKIIEKVLNNEFSNLCDWFVDNRLSIHFGEDKTKSILFASKGRVKKADSLNIIYNNIEIKQNSKVKYLGCILDETLSGESMALHVINKVNNKLKFLYRKNSFLSEDLRRLLCNALIQPHFDFACTSWYPNLNKGFQKKLQIMQNKCVRFCLRLHNRSHIGSEEFQKINWLPVEERFRQCAITQTYKFLNKQSPQYMSELFICVENDRRMTRASLHKLYQPCRKSTQGQRSLSYLGPSIWNSLNEELKTSASVNSFKHNIKKFFFSKLKTKENQVYSY